MFYKSDYAWFVNKAVCKTLEYTVDRSKMAKLMSVSAIEVEPFGSVWEKNSVWENNL